MFCVSFLGEIEIFCEVFLLRLKVLYTSTTLKLFCPFFLYLLFELTLKQVYKVTNIFPMRTEA